MLRPDKIGSAFHWAGCIHRPACGGTAEFRNAIGFLLLTQNSHLDSNISISSAKNDSDILNFLK